MGGRDKVFLMRASSRIALLRDLNMDMQKMNKISMPVTLRQCCRNSARGMKTVHVLLRKCASRCEQPADLQFQSLLQSYENWLHDLQGAKEEVRREETGLSKLHQGWSVVFTGATETATTDTSSRIQMQRICTTRKHNQDICESHRPQPCFEPGEQCHN